MKPISYNILKRFFFKSKGENTEIVIVSDHLRIYIYCFICTGIVSNGKLVLKQFIYSSQLSKGAELTE